MSHEEIWHELEATAPPEGGGRLRRRIHGEAASDIYVELILPDGVRAISVEVDREAVADLGDLPQARGLDHLLVKDAEPGRALLSLELADPAAADIFAALAEDVCRATAGGEDDQDAVRIWAGRIARWQRLLRNAPHGLSPELQRALFAELWAMRELVAPAVGAREAVQAWEGPSGAPHDYQLAGGSLEVKSCAANQPQIVTISNERQLDVLGTDSLHLVHVSLDVHRSGPETLVEMVDSVRNLAREGTAETALEDRLMDYGYLDAHEPRYRRIGYAVREARFFRVGTGFPRLVETDLPEGIGKVTYRLAIAACSDFEVKRDAAAAAISMGHEG
jgi:hypothetical protein